MIFFSGVNHNIFLVSWDEIGNYDLPAIINYILKETGQPKMSYIGHSLGCATFFIAMLKHPELNDKIDTMVGIIAIMISY